MCKYECVCVCVCGGRSRSKSGRYFFAKRTRLTSSGGVSSGISGVGDNIFLVVLSLTLFSAIIIFMDMSEYHWFQSFFYRNCLLTASQCLK